MNRRSELLQDIQNGPSFEMRETTVTVAEAPGRLAQVNDEALRLVHQVFLGRVTESPSVVVFAGMEHGNGCSEICRSVAEALAADPLRSVCLVDANFRTPGGADGLNPPGWSGLTDALVRKGSIRSFMRLLDLRPNLWLLPCGNTDSYSPTLLSSGALHERVVELREEFDFVIIDSPPLVQYPDSIALAQWADGVVLIVEAGKTRRDDAMQAAASVRAAGISILAAVLNKEESVVPDRVLRHL